MTSSSFEDVYRIQTARIMELERELAAARKEIEWLRKDAEIPEEPDGLDELETRNYIATLRDLLRREKAERSKALKVAGMYARRMMDFEDRAEAAEAKLAAIEQAEKQAEPFGHFQYDVKLDAWVKSKTNNGVAFYTTQPATQQAEKQEPVAWMVYTLDGKSVRVTDNPQDFSDKNRVLPLYTIPPAAQSQDLKSGIETVAANGGLLPTREWVGLTDEDIKELWNVWKDALCLDLKTWAFAIEAKLKEKNT